MRVAYEKRVLSSNDPPISLTQPVRGSISIGAKRIIDRQLAVFDRPKQKGRVTPGLPNSNDEQKTHPFAARIFSAASLS